MYNRQLDTFLQVADAGSFSKAAAALYITPTAVIKQINLLETELRLHLFVRTHRGLTLTESGKSLYRDAAYLIQYSQESLARARNAVSPADNVVRIGTSVMTPWKFLEDLWPQMHAHCPEIKLQFIPFENTPENAREILKNLGKNIDVVAGIYDPAFLQRHACSVLPLAQAPLRCAVSVHHRLAAKDKLTAKDLQGENLLLIRRGWNCCVDALRDDLAKKHPKIRLVDFQFYNLRIFNQCENSDDLLLTIDIWNNIHPLLKILPVDWAHRVPFGLLHAPKPFDAVQRFLKVVQATLLL